MHIKPTFRDNGAIGALLDEYEKSINEMMQIIDDISDENLKKIVDHSTQDEDCKSIQTILSHVVQSGYTYVIEIRKWLGENIQYRDKILLENTNDYKNALQDMFAYNVKLFEDHPNIKLNEKSYEGKITVRWGQQFDVEQLIEHAIVHILRHRRQIERFKLKLI